VSAADETEFNRVKSYIRRIEYVEDLVSPLEDGAGLKLSKADT
jgi:hypothetical protein